MTATKKVNYTEDMVATITEMYAQLGNDGIEQIAQVVQRPTRSVISKLVKEGVYRAAEKPAAKAKDEGPTKKELLRDLESAGFDVTGLEPAQKAAIERILNLVRQTQTAESV